MAYLARCGFSWLRGRKRAHIGLCGLLGNVSSEKITDAHINPLKLNDFFTLFLFRSRPGVLIVDINMGLTKCVFGLLAVVTLSLSGCATDPDYYEGEVVPTRPYKKPSLDPNQPAELTGTGQQSDIPGLNESKILGVDPVVEHLDGRTQWANELSMGGEPYTELHDLNHGTGVDHVTILDQNGEPVRQYDTKFDAVQVDSNVQPR